MKDVFIGFVVAVICTASTKYYYEHVFITDEKILECLKGDDRATGK